MVAPAPVPADAISDTDDLPVLGTAVAALADYLVTGDAELLALSRFRGVAVVSPRAFHDHISGASRGRDPRRSS